MNFCQALHIVKVGGKVRLPHWQKDEYMFMSNDGTLKFQRGILTLEDNWIVFSSELTLETWGLHE